MCKYVLFAQIHRLTSLIKNRERLRPAAQMTDLEPRRMANDGCEYTLGQFREHYGEQWYLKHWNTAPLTTPQGNVLTLAERWGGANLPRRQSLTGASRSSDVTQLTVNAPLSDSPLQGNQSTGDTNSSVIQPAARSGDVIQLTNMRQVDKKVKGKAACAKQRELRQCLLTHRTDSQRKYEYDLTDDAWNWHSVVRSQPPDVRDLLIGSGIIKFSFKLLSGIIDTNYQHVDAGYRHVFEIERVDGSCFHLHFHLDGKCDTPVLINGAAAVNDSGDTQHVSKPVQRQSIDYTRDTLSKIESSLEIPAISKSETFMALSLMLEACTARGDIGVDIAIDITDGQSFKWRRWMTGYSQSRRHREQLSVDVTGTGIVKVFVVRRSPVNAIQIACCRTDKTYTITTVPESKKAKYSTSQPQIDWTREPIFRSPWFIREDWIIFREKLNVQ